MNTDKIKTKVLEKVKNLETNYYKLKKEKPFSKGLKKLKGKKYNPPRLLKW